jgi:hypothetical protein
MFDFLDRLRERSPEDRMFIAVSTSAAITGVIAIVWMISFGVTLREGTSRAILDTSSLTEIQKQFDGTVKQGQRVMETLNNLQGAMASTAAGTTSAPSDIGTSSLSSTMQVPQSVQQATTTKQPPAYEIIGP